MPSVRPPLKRVLSLTQLTFYGVGTILGAGIYVLVGGVAGEAGVWAPVSFLIAAVLAAMTGLSFAELSSRFPFSAGEAVYVDRAFGRAWFSRLTGLLVVLTGVVSCATLVNGFAGYLAQFVTVPDAVVIPVICIVLGFTAAWGITQSVMLATVLTLIEVGGLLLVVALALPDAVAGTGLSGAESGTPDVPFSAFGVLAGAGLAFYAFIGFEDMVNVAEEVKGVRRTMPRAIVLALVITTVLYVTVAVVAVRSMPVEILASSQAPLAEIAGHQMEAAGRVIGVIALFAVLNGALIQIVMAARVLYGAASAGWLPAVLGRVSRRTQTPLFATWLSVLAVIAFALWLPLVELARLTSIVILIIFTFVNIALVRVKRHLADPVEEVFEIPVWVPVAGAISSAAFAAVNLVAFVG